MPERTLHETPHEATAQTRPNLTDARSTSPPREATELIKWEVPHHETPHEETGRGELHDARFMRPPPEATAPTQPNWKYNAHSMSPLIKQLSCNFR